MVRSAAWVEDLADQLETRPHQATVTLFNTGRVSPEEDARAERLLDEYPVEVLSLAHDHAITVWTDPKHGDSSAVAVNRLLGVPVTARGAGTMKRLAARLRNLA